MTVWVYVLDGKSIGYSPSPQSGGDWVEVSTNDPLYTSLIDPEITVIMSERAWRDSELSRADVELNKIQDSDPRAKGTVTIWRNYRKLLRSYISDGRLSGTRPVAPY